MISANVNATGPNGTLIVGLPIKRDPLTLPSHRQNENCCLPCLPHLLHKIKAIMGSYLQNYGRDVLWPPHIVGFVQD